MEVVNVKTKVFTKHDGVNTAAGSVIQMSKDEARKFVSNRYGEYYVSKEERAPLMQIDGMTDEFSVLLSEAGFNDLKSITEASITDLTKIRGIGNKTADRFIDSAEEILGRD